ncbi:type III-B CRISPR module RAMP protein Cmr1 [uncultured Thiodictyon sp.]|uniref:type III-B CRISPR module RAMP protein Cmr1 n=1 Tax=uncultured Thiodictyon sp. TaxID=1846217 RepID=UPI0025E57BAD|nr:type III-B CRISPR module RAMP protein Cmr1 [uncultured Thiodictyon sp.]
MTKNALPPYCRLSVPNTCQAWEIPLEVVTPLYGGGAQMRRVDDQTPVRVPSIRGQLRFWWRVLYGGTYGAAQALYRRERDLFGGLGAKSMEVVSSRLTLEVRDLEPSTAG